MLQDIIRKSVMTASSQMQNMAYISTNVANYSTNAYKSKQFEMFLDEAGKIQGTVRTDTSKGGIELTQNPMDLAIDGPGYFYVTQPDGSTAYTRDGRLTINSKGYLTTISGALHGNGIQVPENYYSLSVDKTGKVLIRVKEDDNPKEIGKINLVNFANPGGLKDIGSNLVAQTESSGEPKTVENPTYIKQNAIERSNFNVWDSVADVLRCNGSYIANLRIVKYTDDMLAKAVNLRQ